MSDYCVVGPYDLSYCRQAHEVLAASDHPELEVRAQHAADPGVCRCAGCGAYMMREGEAMLCGACGAVTHVPTEILMDPTWVYLAAHEPPPRLPRRPRETLEQARKIVLTMDLARVIARRAEDDPVDLEASLLLELDLARAIALDEEDGA